MTTTGSEYSLNNAAIASTCPEYPLNDAIAAFFTETSVTRPECDARALKLTGGTVIPVQRQDQTSVLARKVYGQLAPSVSFKGKMGDEISGKEPLYVYVMDRMNGVTHLEFILVNEFPENSQKTLTHRKNFIVDVTKIFALSWNAPQPVDQVYRDQLQKKYIKDLTMLQAALPSRFQHIIKTCIGSMDKIFSLPMVLLHRDFSSFNIMVDETSCHLIGVIDWAEAEIVPFGLNLETIESFKGNCQLKDCWSRNDDYNHLQSIFWNTFREKARDFSEEILCTVKMARITGLLLSRGFTNRLANQPKPVPIDNDEQGCYNMLLLDGLLISPDTRFD